jgi:hypothetical protein
MARSPAADHLRPLGMPLREVLDLGGATVDDRFY